MEYIVLVELTYKDYEFGEYREVELHKTMESAFKRVERAKKESNSYKTLIKFAYDETRVQNEA